MKMLTKSLKKILTKRTFGIFCVLALLLSFGLIYLHPRFVCAEPAESVTNRIYGHTLYDTAVEIAQSGWEQAPTVVLATGVNFPDALTGTVLAHKVNGPLLLTEPNRLLPAVAEELKRLGTREAYLLGGTAALSGTVEQALREQGIIPRRLAGWDQYGTAAAIAGEVAPSADQAFLVNGALFPDALSISSYAAAQGIPILLTRSDSLPPEAAEALDQLGVREVTLIGGTAVIKDSVVEELAQLPQSVRVKARYAGYDQYETNITVLNQYSFNTSTVYTATGENFPDALAGAALAAKSKSPVLLLPALQLGDSTTAYLNQKRSAGSAFTIFGGWGVISYKMESVLRTGVVQPRISLQYTQGGYAGTKGMLAQIQSIPTPATDYADIIAPSWYYLDDTADGNVTGGWDANSADYAKFISAVHSRNLKVLPVIQSSWATTKTADTVLASPAARSKLIGQIKDRLLSTNADGVVIDIEYMNNATAPHLSQFMKELYAELHPLNKLVVQAVMPRTGSESWLGAFDYAALAKSVDYLHIMTYDYSHGSPGPIAPPDWIKKVLNYARTQGVDMSKILLGIPYYGVDWTVAAAEGDSASPAYTRQARGLHSFNGSSEAKDLGMLEVSAQYNSSIQRDASRIPYFSYSDADSSHTAYFDDAQSWDLKLELLNEYGLAGIGAWSLYWTLSPATSNELYPLLKQHLR